MTYDPAFLNTANCRSAITYIDGDKGELLYRGYPIEQLAEHSDYLETAYLILFGELPTHSQLQSWTQQITNHTMLHENIKKFMEGFQYDAHPMGIFLSTVGAMSTFYPDAKHIFEKESRIRQTHRLIAKVPSIAAYAYRHSIGRPYVYPDNDLSFAGNFLNMLFKMTELKYQPNPVLDPRARRPVHPARRPRAELLHDDDADDRQLARGSVLGAGRGRRGALRTAARRRQRGGAAHAERDRLGRSRARVHQEGEERRGQQPADGLRPPRLQVLRPARQGHQAHRRPGVRRHGQEPAARRSRSSSSASRCRTTTSSAASSIPTWTSTPASSTRPWASPWRCSRCSSPSPGRPAGSPSGRKCSSIRSRRSPGRARSTPVRSSASTSPGTNGRSRQSPVASRQS